MAKDFQNPTVTVSRRRPDASGLRLGIVVSRFNSLITERLFEGALAELVALGAERSKITVTEVPGAFELPQAANHLLRNDTYDAVICLGCVIRGETSHYEYICQACAMGLEKLSLETGVPIIFGVLTTENLEQAEERCGGSHGHKGKDCARAAVEMALLVAKQKATIPPAIRLTARERSKELSGAS